MPFVHEEIPSSKREELNRFAPFNSQPVTWVVDAERRIFMIEAGLEPPERKKIDSYPLRFYFNVEGKVIVFDAFRSRASGGKQVRWYADAFLIPKGLAGRTDELHILVSDAMRVYRDSEDSGLLKILRSPVYPV